MPLNLKLIRYGSLKPRQQENYNYQKLSALLADYGFVTMRLSDDWKGADMIAQHIDGDTFLKFSLRVVLHSVRNTKVEVFILLSVAGKIGTSTPMMKYWQG
jgi:hypothetical protein